jgi:hypothetical protein
MTSIIRFSANERINESLIQLCLFSLREVQELNDYHTKI